MQYIEGVGLTSYWREMKIWAESSCQMLNVKQTAVSQFKIT